MTVKDYCDTCDNAGKSECCHFCMAPSFQGEAISEPSNYLKEKKKAVEEKENVNHPQHYNREGGMECLDEMILVFGVEAVKNFCLCNAWKYRYRAADKNGEEDLKKSDWYLKKYKELSGSPVIASGVKKVTGDDIKLLL